MCPDGSKIQACIPSVWASVMELLPKKIRLYDEIETFKRTLKTHLFIEFINASTLAIQFEESL